MNAAKIAFGGNTLLEDGSTIILDEAFDQSFWSGSYTGWLCQSWRGATYSEMSDKKVRIEFNMDGDEHESETK